MKTTSWIRLCIYHDLPSDVEDVLKTHKDVQGYALALHDKFTDEELENEKGDKHVHVVLHLNHSRSFTSIQHWFDHLDGNCLTTSCENPLGAYEYLTHKNDPDKYQFNDDIIISSDGFLAECEATNNYGSARRPDNTATIFERYITGAKLTDLVKEHGKDFLYHYTQYRELLKDVKAIAAKETADQIRLRICEALLLNISVTDPDLVLDTLLRYHDNSVALTDDECSVLGEFQRIAQTAYNHKYKENLFE